MVEKSTKFDRGVLKGKSIGAKIHYLCANYVKGYCRFGSRCNRLHDEEVANIARNTLCPHFKNKGECKFADKCKYKHSNEFMTTEGTI